jgi:hypothetical protein
MALRETTPNRKARDSRPSQLPILFDTKSFARMQFSPEMAK